jgi:hypothetical protein
MPYPLRRRIYEADAQALATKYSKLLLGCRIYQADAQASRSLQTLFGGLRPNSMSHLPSRCAGILTYSRRSMASCSWDVASTKPMRRRLDVPAIVTIKCRIHQADAQAYRCLDRGQTVAARPVASTKPMRRHIGRYLSQLFAARWT